MKTRKSIYLIIFCFVTLFAQAQIRDKVNIDLTDIALTKTQEFDQINRNSIYTLSKEGEPALPFYRVSYVLPIEAKITGVTFQSKEKRLFKQDIYIYPAQPPLPTGYTEEVNFVQPDAKIYDSDAPYPGKLYDIESDDIIQGYHVVTLRIYPFEYLPKSRILHYYPDLEYTVEYEPGANREIIRPETQSVLRADLCRTFIKHLVKNASDVEKFGSTTRIVSNRRSLSRQNTPGLRSQSPSILDEIIPDYIIITCDSLKSAFQPLLEWKTKKGIFTVMETTEEINANYQGSDLTEKIRNYLLAAHTRWGDGLYILLGGDINIVPSRMVRDVDNSPSLQYPTDKYYSISTDWIMNADHTFTGSDSLSYINFLGRVPVSSTQEVSTIMSKIIAYEKANNLGDLNYLKNNLYSNAYMAQYTTGQLYYYAQKNIKSYVENYVPNHIANKFICDNADCTDGTNRYKTDDSFYSNGIFYPSTWSSDCDNGSTNGDIELNRDNFLSCLNTGANLGIGKFHFIYHMDHSSEVKMGISDKDKGQGIFKSDMDNLTNGTSYQILMSGSCHPANFAYDCIAKHYLMKSNGGGVAYIGNTDSGWVNEHYQLQNFVQSIYTMGQYDIGSAYQKVCTNTSSQRWRLHLLGDPEMQVWTDVPQTLNAKITSDTIVIAGQQNVTVSVSGLVAQTDTARICIWKDTEVYETRKVVNDPNDPNHTFTVTPETAGTMYVTVTAHNFFPKEDSIMVNTSTAPNPIIQSVNFTDDGTNGSTGNSNGQNDAGETIFLQIELKNAGINTANSLTATLTAMHDSIQVSNNPASFGSIVSGDTATGQFLYTIAKGTPETLANDTIPIQFQLEIRDASGTLWTKTFNIDIFATDLQQRNKKIVTPSSGNFGANTNVTFDIELQNMGQAPTNGLTAVLTCNSASNLVSSCSATARSYPSIGKFETQTATTPFQFTTGAAYIDANATPLDFTLTVTDAYGKTNTFLFNLTKPSGTVTGLDFTSAETAINLTWDALSSAGGYNIYRCDTIDVNNNDAELGSYVKVNTAPVSFSFFNDIGLDALTKYYYKVTAVSPSGMEGDAVRILAWTSFPQKYLYPITLDTSIGQFRSGVNAADINLDGKQELFAVTALGNLSGWIVGLDYEGQDLYNIDNNSTTYSGFAALGLPGWATPALADIKQEGQYNVIVPTRGSVNKLFCYSVEDKDPIDGKPDLLWSSAVPGEYTRGAVLSNIDNSADGSMEVVVKSASGQILIYDADGILLRTISVAPTYGAIAVADLDGDGDKEIIVGNNDNICVCHHDDAECTPIYSIAGSGYRFRSSIVVADIDGNGQKKILTAALKETSPYQGKIYVINTDGTPDSRWGTQTISYQDNWYSQDIAVGDLDGSGTLNVVAVGVNEVKIWDNAGVLVRTISGIPNPEPGPKNPILADVDGDDEVEIIFDSSDSKNIYAYKQDGTKALGFPLKGSTNYEFMMCVADVDNDGKTEIISASGDKMQVWQTNGNPEKIEWGSERHNPQNTGEYTKCSQTVIRTNTVWNSNMEVCDNIIVESGTLTLSAACILTMQGSSMIIVRPGANLVIDGGQILNANVKALSQSSVTLQNNGYVKLRKTGEFNITSGATFNYQQGKIDITT